MRRRVFVILSILLLISLFVCATACDGSKRNDENLPITPWQDFLVDIAAALDRQYMNISTEKPVVFSIRAQAEDKNTGDGYECALELNLDLNSRSGQQGALRIERVRDGESKILLDVYSCDDTLYWSLWQDDAGEYQRNVFDHAPLIYTLTTAAKAMGGGVDYSTPGALFVALGGIFFTDGNVNADGTKYYFDFDLKKGLDNAVSKDMFLSLPEVLQKVFFSLAKVENYSDMLDRTPSLKGEICIALEGGKISSVDCQSLYYRNDRDDTEKELGVIVPEYTISNGRKDLSKYIPDESLYEAGRLTDVTTVGKVKLENSSAERTEMEYDYEFRAKIDILDLFAGGGDLKSLESDNFFHFRMSHRCSDKCAAFCSDKYDRAKGAVLDVAFSPDDFGTYDVYVSVGARAFLSKRFVSSFTSAESIVSNFIPEYFLAVISSDTLSRQNVDAVATYGQESGSTLAEEILMSLIYSDGSISASIERILALAGFDGESIKTFMTLFKGDAYYIDTVSVEQEYLRWNVSDYDVKRSAVHLYGNDVAGTKQYTATLLSAPNISYKLDTDTVDGVGETAPIYNDIYEDGVLFDSFVPMSRQEIDDLSGSYINAQGENIYGETSDCKLRIVDHSEIDLASNDWQKVKLYCLPVGKELWKLIWEEIGNYEWRKWLCVCVETYIKLDDVDSVEFSRPQKTSYMQGERLSTGDIPDRISADIHFDNGKIKTRYVYATNASDVIFKESESSSSRRFIKSSSDTVLNFYLYGHYKGYKLAITPASDVRLATSTDELTLEFKEELYYSKLRVAEIVWTLTDGTVTRATLPLKYMKINGFDIYTPNDIFYTDPTRINEGIYFKRTGKYSLTYQFDGLSADVALYISPKEPQVDKSKYDIVDATPSREYYFKDYNYSFAAEIFNTYHGDEGGTFGLSVRIRVGRVNSFGGLSYSIIDDPDGHYVLSDARIDRQAIEFPYNIVLPATIYKNISVSFKLMFKQSGFYEIAVNLGSASSVIRIKVDVAAVN